MNLPEIDLRIVEQATSTNELALEAIAKGAAAGTVFAADSQTQGRGRREIGGDRRQWFSPPGENLYLSVVARPSLSLERSAALTIAVGASLVACLRELTGLEVELKWPNDLYIGERKVGGILTEGVTGSDRLEAVAVGLGLNVNVEAQQFPEELRELATSLRAESGRGYDRLSLLLEMARAILDAVERYRDEGLAVFSGDLQRWDWLRHREVAVEAAGGARRGRACGIGSSGGLRVEFEDGSVQEIISGEVQIVGLRK